MDISSASMSDAVFLRANIKALYNEKYHCEKVFSEMREKYPHADENYFASKRKARGCGHLLERTIDNIGPNIKFNTCLCKFKHPLTQTLFTLEKHYANGTLPFEGAVLNQPAQIMELLDIVSNGKIEEENKRKAENNG